MAKAPKPAAVGPMPALDTHGVSLLRPLDYDDAVHVLVSDREWLQVPREVAALLRGDGLEVELYLTTDDDLRHVVSELRVRAVEGRELPGATVARTLRAFGVPSAIDLAVDRCARRWIASDDGKRWVLGADAKWGNAEGAHRAFRPRGRKRGSDAMTAEIEEAARHYNDAVRAQRRAPIKYVCEQMPDAYGFPMNERTANRRIQEAKRRGLIPRGAKP